MVRAILTTTTTTKTTLKVHPLGMKIFEYIRNTKKEDCAEMLDVD